MTNPCRPSVPSNCAEPCDLPWDPAASFASLDAFEIVDPGVAFGALAVDNRIVAQLWIASLDSSRPSRAVQSRACRLLIRKLVSGSEMIDERLRRRNDTSVRTTPSGKPVLFIGGEPSACRVSISHSGHWLGVAITNQVRIGIDVEASRPRARFREMAEYLGWDGEIDNFEEFQARWTLWEACVKLKASSVFASSNPAFEALRNAPTDRQLGGSGPWACVQSCPHGAVHFALVVELDFPRRLRLRHNRPQSWGLGVTGPAAEFLRES